MNDNLKTSNLGIDMLHIWVKYLCSQENILTLYKHCWKKCSPCNRPGDRCRIGQNWSGEARQRYLFIFVSNLSRSLGPGWSYRKRFTKLRSDSARPGTVWPGTYHPWQSIAGLPEAWESTSRLSPVYYALHVYLFIKCFFIDVLKMFRELFFFCIRWSTNTPLSET